MVKQCGSESGDWLFSRTIKKEEIKFLKDSEDNARQLMIVWVY